MAIGGLHNGEHAKLSWHQLLITSIASLADIWLGYSLPDLGRFLMLGADYHMHLTDGPHARGKEFDFIV